MKDIPFKIEREFNSHEEVKIAYNLKYMINKI